MMLISPQRLEEDDSSDSDSSFGVEPSLSKKEKSIGIIIQN